jgi:hypothetical protein
MLQMFLHSVKSFFKGQLFRSNKQVLMLQGLGAVITAGAVLGLNVIWPLWLATLVGCTAGGMLQPWLFKNLKYQ